MSGAITIATTGLSASQKQMDVIGNNLANSSTLGYKSGNTYFSAVLNQSLSGSGDLTVGQGVEVSSIATQFSQGSFETTSSSTDLAIDGDGFFMVEDKDGATYYTRAGNFHIDKDGYLVDSNNYKVQGYNTTNAATAAQLTDIMLANVSSEPDATTEITLGANLDDTAEPGDTFNVSQNVFDSKGTLHNLSITYIKTEGNGMWGFEASLDGTMLSDTTNIAACGLQFDENGVLDSLFKGAISTAAADMETSTAGTVAAATLNRPGQIYQTSVTTSTPAGTGLTFRKTGDTSWELVTPSDYENAVATQRTVSGTDYLYIDLDGEGGTDITLQLAGTWAGNPTTGDTIAFGVTCTQNIPVQDLLLEFGTLTNGATIGVPQGTENVITWDLAGDTAHEITGYSSTSVVKSLSSNGYASGVLKSLDIEGNGTIFGVFTNGQTSELGQIIIAGFPDATSLKKVGNYFTETNASGSALTNEPGSGGLGELLSNSLEISNTDTAKEFINMITAQRAYQANARVITTANDMLTELMNIKR